MLIRKVSKFFKKLLFMIVQSAKDLISVRVIKIKYSSTVSQPTKRFSHIATVEISICQGTKPEQLIV
jgi:hypothetical protein